MEALGKRVALVLWAQDEAGGDRASALAGVLSRGRDGRYYLDRGEKRPVELDDEWLDGLAPVPVELRPTLFGAEFHISLPIEVLKGRKLRRGPPG